MYSQIRILPLIALVLCALLAMFGSVKAEAGSQHDNGLVPPAIIVDSCTNELSLGDSGDGEHSPALPSSPLTTVPQGLSVESPAGEPFPFSEIRVLPPSRAPPLVF